MLILIILILLAVVYSLLLSLISSNLWLWFIWVFGGIFLSALTFVLFILLLYLILPKLSYKSKFKHEVAYQIFKFLMIVLRINMTVEGRENIPEGTFVVYANHKSICDIFIVYCGYHRIMSAVAKDTLKKVPFLYGFMKSFNCIFMNRENEREGVRNLLDGIKLVESGYSMLIFPEGGIKSREVETMVNLKAGAYKLATKPGVPISPASIIGSSKISKRGKFTISKVKIIIHPQITKDEYEGMNTHQIGEYVAKIIDQGVIDGQKKNY